jgi:hypothetical protein
MNVLDLLVMMAKATARINVAILLVHSTVPVRMATG